MKNSHVNITVGIQLQNSQDRHDMATVFKVFYLLHAKQSMNHPVGMHEVCYHCQEKYTALQTGHRLSCVSLTPFNLCFPS